MIGRGGPSTRQSGRNRRDPAFGFPGGFWATHILRNGLNSEGGLCRPKSIHRRQAKDNPGFNFSLSAHGSYFSELRIAWPGWLIRCDFLHREGLFDLR
jgi:hypothetical protein